MQEANAVANFGVEFIAWINTAERQNAGTIWQAKLLAPRLPLTASVVEYVYGFTVKTFIPILTLVHYKHLTKRKSALL